jgi:hypothetical protein
MCVQPLLIALPLRSDTLLLQYSFDLLGSNASMPSPLCQQRAAAPPLGGSKYELNDRLSRLSDLGTHVVLRANTASLDSLRCIDRVSTNDLWACMFVVRSCHVHILILNDCMSCKNVLVIDYSTF